MRAKMARSRELIRKIDKGIMRLDQLPLWWVGAILAVAVFIPFFILGEGSVFPIHDQLDETIMAYVLNARHLWEKTAFFPELLGGIPVSGMQPSAVLFIPLYAVTGPGGLFWHVSLCKGAHRQQYSGGDDRRAFLYAAISAHIWPFRGRSAFAALVFFMPVSGAAYCIELPPDFIFWS